MSFKNSAACCTMLEIALTWLLLLAAAVLPPCFFSGFRARVWRRFGSPFHPLH